MLKYKEGKGLLVRDSKPLQRVTQSTMSRLMPASTTSSLLSSFGLGSSRQPTTVQGSTVITGSPVSSGVNGNPRSPGRDTNIEKIDLVFSSKEIDGSHESVRLPGSVSASASASGSGRSENEKIVSPRSP